MERIKDWLSALVTKRAKPTKLVPFQYPPLGAPTHIRLLEILPGKPNSEVRFRVREKILGDGGAYYALSYAWGPPIFTRKIYSAEGFIQVTENLWKALNRYRKADELMTLWVDAVCIDQANNQERAQQIVLMRMIYAESRCTLIWLGPESPSDRLAVEFITRAVDLSDGKGVNNDDLCTLYEEIYLMRTDGYQDAVTGFFAKSWFSRVWTYQEMYCAAKATLSSGPLSIQFKDLQRFCFFFTFTQHEIWLKSKEAQHNLRQIATLIVMRDYPSPQSAASSLLDLVKRTRLRLATDPRDKIYGLLALASDANPLPFAPTYEIAVNRLYEEFAAHVMRQNESLDVFGCCHFQPGLRDCPSWVPDWRCSEELNTPINIENDTFHAAGTSCWDTRTAIVDHSLSVEAYCLDSLQNITSPEPTPNILGLTDYESFEPAIRFQQSIFKETMEMTSSSLLYKSEQERWHAWCWTLVGGKNQRKRATPDFVKRVMSYTEVINGMPNHDLDIQDFNQLESREVGTSVSYMQNHRKFCLTREGRIGWVPLAARTGDIVSLMRGSPVPVIIRPSQQGDSYLMIGQCYMHGIMDGEAFVGNEDQFRRIQLV